jgi:hypothetical protein
MIARWLVSSGPWPFIVLAGLDRIALIALFGSQYVSTDDAVMWHAANDFAQGHFYSVYYYGQAYGAMLEAWLAVPFVWLGIPFNILMPSVSSLLALLPYWSFALWHHHRNNTSSSIFIACIPLLMPTEFGLMTTIPRGFVSGIAILAILPWVKDLRNFEIGAVLIGVVSSIAWFINPNSLVFSIAFIAHYIFKERTVRMSSIRVAAGSMVGFGLYVLSQHWCAIHPEWIIHVLIDPTPKFDLTSIVNGLSIWMTIFSG